MDNIVLNAFLITSFTPLIFLIFTGILYLSFRKQPQKDKNAVFLLLFCINAAMAWLPWSVRILVLPINAGDTALIYYYLCYFFGTLCSIMCSLMALQIIRPDLLKKYRMLILSWDILGLVAVEWALIGVDLNNVTFLGIDDFSMPLFSSLVVILVGFSYYCIPLLTFLYLIIKSSDDPTFREKMLFLEIGLLIFSLMIIVEGAKIVDDGLIGFVRLFAALGGLFMLIGYKLS